MDIRPPGSSPYPDPRQGGYQSPPPPPPSGHGYPGPAGPQGGYPPAATPPPPGYGYPGAPAPVGGYQPGPATPVTYRPWRQARTSWFVGGIAGLAVMLVLVALRLFSAYERGGETALVVTLVLAALIAGGAIGVYLVYLRTLSVTVDGGGITRRAFGRSRRIPRDLLQRVVLCSYLQRSRYATREVPLVALLDAGGRAQLTLNLNIWSGTDAQAIVSQLGLMGRVTSLGLRSRRQLRKEVPGALPWMVAHPVATTLIVVGVTFVVVIALSVGLVLAGS